MKGVGMSVDTRISHDSPLPALDAQSDKLFTLTLAALNRPNDADRKWEQAFARSFLESAGIRKISRALSFRYRVDLEDIHQQLAITILQKLRDRDFRLATVSEFLALAFKIGERFCLPNIREAWDTRSLEDLREQAPAHGATDLGDEDDEGHGAVEMERSASLQMSGTHERLRVYIVERGDPPKLRRSDTHDRKIHPSPSGDDSVKKQDGKPLTKPDAPVDYLNLEINQVDTVLKSSQGRPPVSTTGGAIGYRRNAEQQELFNYWIASGLSQENFAASIDVSLAAFKSYIYGKTKEVPAQVVEKARTYQSRAESLSEKLQKHFNFPMAIILARWERRLGLTQPRDGDVAAILGVNQTTVLRWRSEDTKPKARDLARYELAVNSWASNRLKSTEKASELTPRKPRNATMPRAAGRGRVAVSK